LENYNKTIEKLAAIDKSIVEEEFEKYIRGLEDIEKVSIGRFMQSHYQSTLSGAGTID
jgi:hypothetical protein